MRLIEFKSTMTNSKRKKKKKADSERKPKLYTEEEYVALTAMGGLEMIFLQVNITSLIEIIKESPVLGVVFTDELEQQIRSLILEQFNDQMVKKIFQGECPESLSAEEAQKMYNQMFVNLEDKYFPLVKKNGRYLSVDEREEEKKQEQKQEKKNHKEKKQQDSSNKVMMFPGTKEH